MQALLNRLIDRQDLSHEEMLELMRAVMSGELTPVQIAGHLVALRAKGESVGEITAAAQVMRELSTKVPVSSTDHLVDTCGTGGDGAHSFNVSTASAIVAAAAGARVAKHGGRSVSSTCGSADVLEELGVNVNLTPDQVAQCLNTVGVGFMFAPNHHSAMKYAAPVRKELGVRTLFNLLGPLTNPASAPNQVMGVFHKDWVPKLAEVLKNLGSRHVMVVHGEDGMDEISICAGTHVAELKDGQVHEYHVRPQNFGMSQGSADELRVHDRAEAKARLLAALDNHAGAARDIVAINAGAAIYVSGLAPSLVNGVARAAQVLESGAAKAKLHQLIEFTSKFKSA